MVLHGLTKPCLAYMFIQILIVGTNLHFCTQYLQNLVAAINNHLRYDTIPAFTHFYPCSPAKQEDIDTEGTALLLSVFDYNVIGANGFVGMCVVACKDIPQMVSTEASLTDPNSPQQINLTLPLFRYTNATPVFVELDARAGLEDDKAGDFFKTNKHLNLLGDLHQLRRYSSVLDSMSLPPMKKLDFSFKLN